MIVSLIQRPTEIPMGRKTILVDGSQVGYFHGAARPLIFTLNMEKEEAAIIRAEVERIEGVKTAERMAIPPPTPPEWMQPEEVAEAAVDVDDEEY